MLVVLPLLLAACVNPFRGLSLAAVFLCSGQSVLPWPSETAGQSGGRFSKWKGRQGSSVRLCIPHRACHSHWHRVADGCFLRFPLTRGVVGGCASLSSP